MRPHSTLAVTSWFPVLVLSLFTVLGARGASSQDVVPGTPYVQYRTYENSSQNRYVGWAAYYHSDGTPIASWELAGPPVLTDPNGAAIEPQSTLFWTSTFLVGIWDIYQEKFVVTNTQPAGQSGYLLNLSASPVPGLTTGWYAFDAVTSEGSPVPTETAFFPETRLLTPVSSTSMAANWATVDDATYLDLSWAPSGDAAYGDFDRYQITLLDAVTGQELFYGHVPPEVTSVRLDPALLQGIANLAGLFPGDSVNWVVQERAYSDVYNFARSYSTAVEITWQEVTLPPPPANDTVRGATVVDVTPFTDTVDTQYATVGGADLPLCGVGESLQATIWYVYTAPEDLQVVANTFQSPEYWTLGMNVVQGTPGNFTLVACGGPEVNFAAAAGQTYYFMVGTYTWAPPGLVTFYLNATVPLDIGLSVNPTGSFDRVSGAALVSGVLTCNRPVDVSISGTVRQTVGRFHVIEGAFARTVSCDGSTRWDAQAMSSAGSFGGGGALVQVFASAVDPPTGQYDSAEVAETVSLRGSKGK